MSHPVRDYFVALAICVCCAAVYRISVVPLIEPPIVKRVVFNRDAQQLKPPDLSHVFPPGSWQLTQPKFLQAEWGWILYDKLTQDTADRFRVYPVSVVMKERQTTSTSSPSGPILLDASEGAIIELEKGLDLLSGTAPTIKAGQLLGDVRIYNKTEVDDSHYQIKNKPLQFELITKNVRIDNREIRSTEQFQLTLSGNRLVGRDISLKLAGGRTIPTSVESPLAILDTMELIYLHELTIELPNGPLWQPATTKVAKASQNRARLTLNCDGRVVFDFSTLILSLNEHVVLRHHWSETDCDTFDCRDLQVKLVNPYLVDTDRPSTSEGGVDRISRYVKGILVRGAPVQADVSSMDARFTAYEIAFDMQSRKLDVVSGPDDVHISVGPFDCILPSFTYTLNATDPKQPGQLSIVGAGQVRVSDPKIPISSITWNKLLEVFPAEDQHRLWVDGGVQANLRDGGKIVSSELLVGFSSHPEYQVNQLRARGGVDVDTNQLAAQTETLLILFEYLDAIDPSSASLDAAHSGADGPRLIPATGPRQKMWITDPADMIGRVSQPVAKPRPALFGDEITARASVSQQEIVAFDLSVKENVRLEHELQTPQQPLPMAYTGDALRFISGSGDDYIQISGKPARIVLDSGFFEGPHVIVSGRDNRVSILEYGTFEVPIALIPTGKSSKQQGSTGNGQAISWLRPPRCDFQGRLEFDGQRVEIADSVHLSGQLSMNEGEIWRIDAKAPKLELLLDHKIQVMNPASARAASVERISLLGEGQGVLITATEVDHTNRPMGHHVLSSQRLDLNAATGRLVGPGPGWYRSWAPTDENSPIRSLAPPGALVATHLLYSGQIEGNFSDKQLAFQQGVRVGISAVPDWNTSIDAAVMSQLDLNQATVDCDRLQIGMMEARSNGSSDKLQWEIQGLGGVAFRMLTERGLIDGTAARVSYDSRADLFVLEGTPQRDAVVRNTSLTGQPVFQYATPSFTLRPGTMEVNTLLREANIRSLPR